MNWKILKKDLENTFLCKYYRLRNRLTYPSFILPKNRYVSLIRISELCTLQRLYILRRSNKTLENTFHIIGDKTILREDSIEPIDVPNMSLNLMGGKFKERHLKFIPKMRTEAVKKWDGFKRIYLSEFLNDYEKIETFCPIYFDVNNIDLVNIPYQQNKSKEINRLLLELGEKPVEKNEKYQFTAQTEVMHDPTFLNYWHVEFKLKDFRGVPIARKQNAWIDDLSRQTIKNILSVNAYHTLPTAISSIPQKYYLKREL
jgi:hypothetical protein